MRAPTPGERDRIEQALVPFVDLALYHGSPIYHALVDSLPDILVSMLEAWGSRAREVETEARQMMATMMGSPAVARFPRLSTPGNVCASCGMTMGVDLRCPGCGQIDPLTKSPDQVVADPKDS